MPTSPTSLIDRVAASLSVATLRHQAIASNIANRDTPEYQRLKLGFDRALGGVSSSDSGSSPRAALVAENADIKPSLEDDMVSLSANTMNYQVLTRALSRYFALLGAITNSNRG